MAWQVVVVSSEERADDISGRMWSAGTLGVEFRDHPSDAPPGDPTLETEGRVEIRASFSHRVAAEEALAMVEADHPSWMVEVADDSGLDAWRPYARMERAGDFLIRPTWVVAPERPGPADARLIEIAIDPGRTFGSGSHASTRLALTLLSRYVAHTRSAPTSVLDVGTGSGVLAIAAAKLGADTAVGIDIDQQSPAVGAANAQLNGVGNRLAILNVPLGSIDGRFDLVIANILAPVLVELAPELVEKMAPNGRLVLAGFLAEQEDLVLQAFPGLCVVDRSEELGWSAVALEVAPATGAPQRGGDDRPEMTTEGPTDDTTTTR